MARTQELMQSIAMGVLGHNSALVEFALHSFKAYEAFKGQISDAFLLRLLNFPLEEIEQDAEAQVELSEGSAGILV